MKKWIVAVMSALFLAALVSGPIGCGPGEATKIDTSGAESKQPPGHEQAVENMNKAAESGKK